MGANSRGNPKVPPFPIPTTKTMMPILYLLIYTTMYYIFRRALPCFASFLRVPSLSLAFGTGKKWECDCYCLQ